MKQQVFLQNGMITQAYHSEESDRKVRELVESRKDYIQQIIKDMEKQGHNEYLHLLFSYYEKKEISN